ncbi:MAG: LOG family protein [Acidobacteria bacterium]|nr:LOG family protein [Acidobacteriota bacterium]
MSFQPLPISERGVAVFGSGSAEPDSELYTLARAVGFAVGRRGVPVVTGGYGGVMEGAALGARDAGAEAIGVTCRAFRERRPNPYLSLEIEEQDLFVRTSRLCAVSRGFVVLGGSAGTLAELAELWNQARVGLLPGPVVLLDPFWDRLFRDLARAGRLEPGCLESTTVAAQAEEAAAAALAPWPRTRA